MKTLKERIAIEQAALDGKTIEWNQDNKGRWEVWSYAGTNISALNSIPMNWDRDDYRVKKETKEIVRWFVMFPDGSGNRTFSTREEAEKSLPFSYKARSHVVEMKGTYEV